METTVMISDDTTQQAAALQLDRDALSRLRRAQMERRDRSRADRLHRRARQKPDVRCRLGLATASSNAW